MATQRTEEERRERERNKGYQRGADTCRHVHHRPRADAPRTWHSHTAVSLVAAGRKGSTPYDRLSVPALEP